MTVAVPWSESAQAKAALLNSNFFYDRRKVPAQPLPGSPVRRGQNKSLLQAQRDQQDSQRYGGSARRRSDAPPASAARPSSFADGNQSAASELEGQAWRGGQAPTRPDSKKAVSYFFPKDVGEYHFGERHPMKPHRLTLTNHLVMGYGLHQKMGVYQPRIADKAELQTFHDQDYIDFLSRITPDNAKEFGNTLSRFNIGDDCPIFDSMFDYCRQYAGASLSAARRLAAGTTDIAINWAGGLHHAKKSEASGFCYVNDIVLGILELLRVHARVLYIDIDIHHGDGVQEAFYNSNRVLTMSFHKYSEHFFPGTGHMDELGSQLGKYFSLNVPLQDGIDNESYVALFKSIMEPTIATFQPSVIVLQCGADSLGCDRLGCFNLSIAAHGECVRFIKAFNLPLLVLGGGGYTIKNVSRCWTYETSVLLDAHNDISNVLPMTAYDDFFAPDFKLHPPLSGKIENLNTRKQLDQIRVGLLERLRFMHGAPSVQMSVIPPELAPWLDQEEEIEAAARQTSDGRKTDQHKSGEDYFSSQTDQDQAPVTPGDRITSDAVAFDAAAYSSSARLADTPPSRRMSVSSVTFAKPDLAAQASPTGESFAEAPSKTSRPRSTGKRRKKVTLAEPLQEQAEPVVSGTNQGDDAGDPSERTDNAPAAAMRDADEAQTASEQPSRSIDAKRQKGERIFGTEQNRPLREVTSRISCHIISSQELTDLLPSAHLHRTDACD
ncbi:hypothetical protein E5Q_00047 [Mixia osmundae IAM 14324]|uniref:histone deacetylase n=1 Tax=Mixia osmundae (strain CBS 9802 / IAM 14324 / JCM 22182 / KY 12970) TaxID=764103 RepID=G7DS46_MIXOS|nr:hypothetical protein E5Q_00047 [Mixia osmundae IAM 14324]